MAKEARKLPLRPDKLLRQVLGLRLWLPRVSTLPQDPIFGFKIPPCFIWEEACVSSTYDVSRTISLPAHEFPMVCRLSLVFPLYRGRNRGSGSRKVLLRFLRLLLIQTGFKPSPA